MKTTTWTLAGIFVSMFVVGCGGSATPEPQVAQAPTTAAEQTPNAVFTPAVADVSSLVAANSLPEQVVEVFMNAMKQGDSGVAAALLTDTAREETAKHDLHVQPPGAADVRYLVGAAIYPAPNADTARVPCQWQEPDGQGGSTAFEATWALRRVPQGWRVSGLLTEVFAGHPPILFDFEHPESMRTALEEAQAAIVAEEASKAQTQTATPSALNSRLR